MPMGLGNRTRLQQQTEVMDAGTKVRIRGLRKRFLVRGRPVDAIAGVDFDIRNGEFLCIVGPSGCGKTTMLRILDGLETPSQGQIAIGRSDPQAGTSRERP